MVKLTNSFCSIKPFFALVIGDFLLDTYTTGNVRRISPEAPVPVMEVASQESRPGGAGNAVLNLATLGGHVTALGRVGNDPAGFQLQRQLMQANITGFVVEFGYQTPVKNRLISNSQQLIRIDFETVSPLPAEYEKTVIESLEQQIPTVQVVAISDYGKGFLTPTILAEAIRIAKKHRIPIIIDPKGSDFFKYRGATVLKPNLSEAYAAAKLPLTASLDQVAQILLQITDVDLLLITRSEEGISLFDRQGVRSDFPVRLKEVKDVTGAGDTVLATICMALANRLDMETAVQLANISAGISIERLGCVQVTLSEIARRLVELDLGTKIFDEKHTFALHHVLKDRQYALLALSSGQEMTNMLFKTIRNLSFRHSELVIYLRGAHPSDEMIELLSSLNEVNFIIFQSQSLKHLCEVIHPTTIFSLENGILSQIDQGLDLIARLQVNAILESNTSTVN
jgi:D-beta-D-heptose 7-phosphate kinase/D-beta-D-heptose 1-phosphate adenosyltransferase